MYADERDLICYYKKDTIETISSVKCSFLNRDCVEYTAGYLGEYTDIRKERWERNFNCDREDLARS